VLPVFAVESRGATVLIAGCGYVGSALGERLATAGHVVFGLRRRRGDLPASLRFVAADLSDPTSLAALPAGLEWVVYAAAADAASDDAYRAAYVDGPRHLLAALSAQGQRPSRVLFTSSTSVYGQQGGEWVDETSATEPRSFSGRRMLEGERIFLNGPFPAVVLRLGGIYGPGRTRLVDAVLGKREIAPGAGYTNRIHRDDAAGAIIHLLSLERPEPLYLGVDHEPAETRAVIAWLAARLGVAPPRLASPTGADNGLRRGSTNKRCRNDRLCASGYVFAYPTFREGYGAILQEPGEARSRLLSR
jgi:nucleoside-diphosphate-sugar epimerase